MNNFEKLVENVLVQEGWLTRWLAKRDANKRLKEREYKKDENIHEIKMEETLNSLLRRYKRDVHAAEKEMYERIQNIIHEIADDVGDKVNKYYKDMGVVSKKYNSIKGETYRNAFKENMKNFYTELNDSVLDSLNVFRDKLIKYKLSDKIEGVSGPSEEDSMEDEDKVPDISYEEDNDVDDDIVTPGNVDDDDDIVTPSDVDPKASIKSSIPPTNSSKIPPQKDKPPVDTSFGLKVPRYTTTIEKILNTNDHNVILGHLKDLIMMGISKEANGDNSREKAKIIVDNKIGVLSIGTSAYRPIIVTVPDVATFAFYKDVKAGQWKKYELRDHDWQYSSQKEKKSQETYKILDKFFIDIQNKEKNGKLDPENSIVSSVDLEKYKEKKEEKEKPLKKSDLGEILGNVKKKASKKKKDSNKESEESTKKEEKPASKIVDDVKEELKKRKTPKKDDKEEKIDGKIKAFEKLLEKEKGELKDLSNAKDEYTENIADILDKASKRKGKIGLTNDEQLEIDKIKTLIDALSTKIKDKKSSIEGTKLEIDKLVKSKT